MNSTLNIVLLLSVPALPLLLAVPALHARLYRPCHFALLPAVLLLTVPAVSSIELPWLLFGSGLGIDGPGRLLLLMSVVLWASATSLIRPPADQAAHSRLTTLLLLTMAGNLGAILATELVGFFTFSALMGYGFYGLLVEAGDETARRAGRVYLGFLVLADLLLFEALLIAAATSGDLNFEAVHQSIGQSPASGLYLSMVLAGFVLKAGIWPLHFWLPLAFRSTRPAMALLLGGLPVAIALLGMVRWLPAGESALPDMGAVIQWLALCAAIYATIAGLMQAHPRSVLAYATIVVTSLFVTTLDSGPVQGSAFLFIPYLGFTLAALIPGSVLPNKVNGRLVPGLLLPVGHAAEALLLTLLPVMIFFQGSAGENPLFSDSWIATLWPWWTLCTTLLAVRWFYLLSHRQQAVVSIPSLATGIVWSVLLVAAYVTGLLAAVLADNPMDLAGDVVWPISIGILLGGSAWWMAVTNRLPAMPAIPPGDLWPILERWLSRSNHWARSVGLEVLPRWRAAVLAAGGRCLHVRAWQKALDAGERSLQSWTLAVTLLLLLGIVIAIAVG